MRKTGNHATQAGGRLFRRAEQCQQRRSQSLVISPQCGHIM